MALRIGKKKDASNDDWSETALLGATDDNTSTPAPTTVPATAEPADTFVADNFAPAAPPRKSLSPVLLAAGLVLLLTAVGVGAYFLFFSAPAEDTTAPPVVPAPRVATAPDAPPDVPPPAAPPEAPPAKAPVAAPAAKPTPRKIVVKPARNEPPRKVRPGKAGLIPPNTKVPAVRPKPAKPPAVAPKPNQPTPVPIMPDGVAAQPGKGLRPGTTVPVVQPPAALTPALMTQLKTLWQQGAAAKHRGDYAAARRAWTKMLQLHPGHPGVQEAINKLPR